MSQLSPRLALPLMMAAQAQKHVTHNEALLRLDLLVQLAVAGFDAETPPTSPAEGEIWALGASPTGAWAGAAGQLAAWLDGAWTFLAPAPGWRAWSAADGLRVFDGTLWSAGIDPGALQNLAGVGIGTSYDATNKLAVAAAATLLSHAGSDHRLAVNRAGTGDTASLLFQSGFSGRAEIGLAGSDELVVKTSPDGSAWTEALRVDASAGTVSGAAVQQSSGDTTSGRLMRADWGVTRDALVGLVSQSGGAPTGAVFESGSNANGDYVRYADGTQICARQDWTPAAGGSSWTFPAAFAALAGTSVTATATDTATPAVATAAATSATDATVRLFTLAGSGVAAGVTTLAFGRWF